MWSRALSANTRKSPRHLDHSTRTVITTRKAKRRSPSSTPKAGLTSIVGATLAAKPPPKPENHQPSTPQRSHHPPRYHHLVIPAAAQWRAGISHAHITPKTKNPEQPRHGSRDAHYSYHYTDSQQPPHRTPTLFWAYCGNGLAREAPAKARKPPTPGKQCSAHTAAPGKTCTPARRSQRVDGSIPG